MSPVTPQGEETHHVAVIMSNPDQSKHLETARMKIRGVWIDLVNLRSETYTQHSRIPTMEVRAEGGWGNGFSNIVLELWNCASSDRLA